MKNNPRIMVSRDNVWSVEYVVSKPKPNGSIDYLYNGIVQAAPQFTWDYIGDDWSESKINQVIVENNVATIDNIKFLRKSDKSVADEFQLADEPYNGCDCLDCQRKREQLRLLRAIRATR